MNLSYGLCALWALSLLALTCAQPEAASLEIEDETIEEADGFSIDEHFADFELDAWKHPDDETTTEADHHDANRHEKEAAAAKEEEIRFNSTEEPLMVFSTGLSIKGYWMRSKVLFDIASVGVTKANPEHPPAAQAISFILDMISPELAGAPASKMSEVVTLRARSTIVGVDMDPMSKEVFWVELGRDAGVYSTILDSENFESHDNHRRAFSGTSHRYSTAVVDSGLLSPEDVALDLVARNIYITDAGLPAVVVCTLKHSYCKLLVKDNIHKPRAIIVDPTTGWLTYSDWSEQRPGIFMVSMDGKRRETLIDTDIVWPNALASDHSSNQLYWADAKLSKIERVDLRTKQRYIIVKEISSSPFSLSQFEDRIYWSDWAGSDIRTCNKMSGNQTKVLMATDNIYGIHIYHPNISQKQLDTQDPCWSKRCTHLCLLSPVASSFVNRREGSIMASCACPESMSLSLSDKSTCYESQRSYLLLNVKDYVAQMFPDRIGLHVIEKVIYAKNHSINDIALNPIHQKLYLFDAAQRRIHLVDLLSDHLKVEPFMSVPHTIKGLLYDSLSNNLFWLDPENGTLSMCLIRSKMELFIRKGLDRPTSLVLDSRYRVLYIALAGQSPRIIRADILGSERLDLAVVATDIVAPVAMQLDEVHQRLYWADASLETIESIDLDYRPASLTGVKPNTRVIHRKTQGRVTAFAVYHDSLLWTIRRSDYLFKSKMHVEGGDAVAHQHITRVAEQQEHQHPISYRLAQSNSWLHSTGDDRTKMILVEPRHQPQGSPCWTKECKHGCVLDADHSPICICPNSNQLEFCEDVEKRLAGDTSMVWLIVLLLLLSITGLITLASLLTLYKQGRFPTQVSQFSVSFIQPNRNKDGAMLLLDTDG